MIVAIMVGPATLNLWIVPFSVCMFFIFVDLEILSLSSSEVGPLRYAKSLHPLGKK